MADRLGIMNAALLELGEDPLEEAAPITGALDDAGDDIQARVGAIYPQVRDKMLYAHPWSWLSRRQQLIEVPAGQGENVFSWPFKYRYAVPDPDVRVIRAVWDRSDQIDHPARVDGWRSDGPYIYADFRPAWIESLSNVDEAAWPRVFANAIIVALAARLSMSIKEDLPTTRYYEQLAERALSDAQRVDAQGHPAVEIQRFEWVDERISGGRFHHGVV